MSVLLGAVSQACLRRALFSGRVSSAEWALNVTASFIENGDTRRPSVTVTRVLPESAQGRLVRAVSVELDLVAAEGAAWKALSRRDVDGANGNPCSCRLSTRRVRTTSVACARQCLFARVVPLHELIEADDVEQMPDARLPRHLW